MVFAFGALADHNDDALSLYNDGDNGHGDSDSHDVMALPLVRSLVIPQRAHSVSHTLPSSTTSAP